MSEEFVARVRRRDTREPEAIVTPNGHGLGFVPDDESTDSKPVYIEDRRDALYLADHEDFVVEWLDEEAQPA